MKRLGDAPWWVQLAAIFLILSLGFKLWIVFIRWAAKGVCP